MNQDNKKATTGIVAQENDKQIVSQEETLVNDYDIDAFLEKRKEFITKVNKIMVEGKDYHVIQGKKSLAKGGAEKISSIFGWQAGFIKDEDVASAFKLDGLIAFKCSLTKANSFVGEGRGAATLSKNNSDPNKTIKMAQKSAFIDAVLRASGLSDFFTQDLEDMNGFNGDKGWKGSKENRVEPDINQIVPGVPPVNTYQKILDGINKCVSTEELDTWRDSLKYAKKMITIKQYSDLRAAGVKKRQELENSTATKAAAIMGGEIV